jgi:hypothetical protein
MARHPTRLLSYRSVQLSGPAASTCTEAVQSLRMCCWPATAHVICHNWHAHMHARSGAAFNATPGAKLAWQVRAGFIGCPASFGGGDPPYTSAVHFTAPKYPFYMPSGSTQGAHSVVGCVGEYTGSICACQCAVRQHKQLCFLYPTYACMYVSWYG